MYALYIATFNAMYIMCMHYTVSHMFFFSSVLLRFDVVMCATAVYNNFVVFSFSFHCAFCFKFIFCRFRRVIALSMLYRYYMYLFYSDARRKEPRYAKFNGMTVVVAVVHTTCRQAKIHQQPFFMKFHFSLIFCLGAAFNIYIFFFVLKKDILLCILLWLRLLLLRLLS